MSKFSYIFMLLGFMAGASFDVISLKVSGRKNFNINEIFSKFAMVISE